MFLHQKPEGTPNKWLLVVGQQRGPQEGMLFLPLSLPSQGCRRVFPAWTWVKGALGGAGSGSGDP